MTFISDSNTLTGSMNAVGRPWWVYMLECRGGGIYIGIALDVDARFAQHVAGKGAKYTRLNAPVRILVRVRFDSHREAAQAEVCLLYTSRCV